MRIADAPPEILTALREIDPAADLVCVQGGYWILGVRAPNPAAEEALAGELKGDPHGAILRATERDEAQSMMAMPRAGARLALLQLYASGFKPIRMIKTDRPTHEIVDDFRIRDFNWRTRPEAAFDEFRQEASMDVQNAKRSDVLREFVRGEGHSLFKFIMKRAKGFLQRVPIPGAAR